MIHRVLATVLVALVVAACGGGTSSSPASTAFCSIATAADQAAVQDPFAPDIEPAEVERRVGALVDRLATLAAAAPPAIREDIALLRSGLESLDGLLSDAGYDFERLAASGADVSAFDGGEFTAASARVATYQTDNCQP